MSSLREVPGKMFQLAENRQEAGRELRDCVVETLQELMKDDDKITALEADLGGASGFTKIKKTNPERFIQCGIAEANMMGVAAGLSLTGFKPFTHTFAPFATRRVFDQLFLSGAYAGNTINVYGSDPGFSVASNGGTHTAWEDVALIREIPGAVICDPADDVQMEWIIKEFLKMEGIHYVRSNRKAVRNVYKKGSSFKIGQGNILKEGKDILIIAAGQLVSEALDCAEELEKEGYSVEVIDMFTIKPLDEKLLIKEKMIEEEIQRLQHTTIGGKKEVQKLLEQYGSTLLQSGSTLADLLKRPELSYDILAPIDEDRQNLPEDVCEQVNISLKYEGYITRQQKQVIQYQKLENRKIPEDIDYTKVNSLRKEAVQKLDDLRPISVGQASRISGVSPADISVLLIYLEHYNQKKL